jgi:hypothetical protein
LYLRNGENSIKRKERKPGEEQTVIQTKLNIPSVHEDPKDSTTALILCRAALSKGYLK